MKPLIRERLTNHPILVGLDVDAIEQFIARCREQHFGPGAVIYERGGQADAVYLLLQGGFQIEYPEDATRARGRVVTILTAPAVFGECQTLAETTWSGTGVSVSKTILVGINKSDWLSLARQSADFATQIYLEVVERFHRSIEARRASPNLKPDALIARYMIAFMHCQDDEQNPETLALAQKDIALATGVRRETVNRVLSDWVEQGWIITERGSITVRNSGELSNLAGASLASFAPRLTTPV